MQLLQPEMVGMLLSNVNQEGILVEPASANDVSFTEMFLSNSGFTLPVPVNCHICTKMVRFFFSSSCCWKEAGAGEAENAGGKHSLSSGHCLEGRGRMGMRAGLRETQTWGDGLRDSCKVILLEICSCRGVGVSFQEVGGGDPHCLSFWDKI